MDRFLSRRIRVVFQAIVPAFRTPRFARYWTLRPVAAVALVAVFAAVSGARVAVAQDEQSDDEMVVVHTASGIDASADTVYYNLNTGELAAKDASWLAGRPGEPFEAAVRIRYRHAPARAPRHGRTRPVRDH